MPHVLSEQHGVLTCACAPCVVRLISEAVLLIDNTRISSASIAAYFVEELRRNQCHYHIITHSGSYTDAADSRRAGMCPNLEKSTTDPVHTLRHLGSIVGAATGFFLVPEDRWDRLQRGIHTLLHAHRAECMYALWLDLLARLSMGLALARSCGPAIY